MITLKKFLQNLSFLFFVTFFFHLLIVRRASSGTNCAAPGAWACVQSGFASKVGSHPKCVGLCRFMSVFMYVYVGLYIKICVF